MTWQKSSPISTAKSKCIRELYTKINMIGLYGFAFLLYNVSGLRTQKPIFVTGGTSRVGRRVVSRLSGRGCTCSLLSASKRFSSQRYF